MEETRQLFTPREVDIFTAGSLSGYGMTVFETKRGTTRAELQEVMEQRPDSECVFIERSGAQDTVAARIFTNSDGGRYTKYHLFGSAAVLHELATEKERHARWLVEVDNRRYGVDTECRDDVYRVSIDQGATIFGRIFSPDETRSVVEALGLGEESLDACLPIQLVTTESPTVVVPVQSGVDHVRVDSARLEGVLESVGRVFVCVVDINSRQGKTWADGVLVDDLSIGAVAGSAIAYLVQYGRCQAEEEIELSQGHYFGLESKLFVTISRHSGGERHAFVSADVRVRESRASSDAAGVSLVWRTPPTAATYLKDLTSRFVA